MSLARLALRIATIEALRGATSVRDNVLDSEIGSLDIGADGSMRTDQEKPFISVYTEKSKVSDLQGARAIWRNGPTELLIETGIAASMTETNPDTGKKTVVGGLAATDAAFEFFLDQLDRQIIMVLTDPLNEWSEVWRKLMGETTSIERKRLSDPTADVRMAARQLWIGCQLVPDPPYGEAIGSGSAFGAFLSQMRAVNHEYLPKIEELLGLSSTQRQHEETRRHFGLTLDEARALCITPPLPAENAEPPITKIEVAESNG